nr:hypothetical protein [Brevundimonas diminuta]
MVIRIGKTVGLLGLGAATTLVAAILMAWPPLAARSPEVTFTVLDRAGEANSGRAVTLDFANAHGFTLLGRKEEAMKPDTLYFHHLFRMDSHIFVQRGLKLGETEVDFRKSINPWGRSGAEVRVLAHSFEQQMADQGFLVETHWPDK